MLYFLYGDSAPLQIKYEKLLTSIKNQFPKIPYKIYDASIGELPTFMSSIAANSIFNSKELIVLKRVESLKTLDDLYKSLSIYNLAQKEVVLVYEEFLNQYDKPINKISEKTLANFENIAKIVCYRKENEKKAILFHVQHELNISETEAMQLIESIGNDYFKITNEIEKIRNFLDGEQFSFEKIKSIISFSEEYNLKTLIDNFIEKKECLPLLNYLEKEKTYNSFFHMITEELIFLLKLTLLYRTGIFSKSISYKRFNEGVFDDIKEHFFTEKGYPHPYTLFLRLKNCDSFKIEFLENQLEELLEIDYKYKSGIQDINLQLELFILAFHK